MAEQLRERFTSSDGALNLAGFALLVLAGLLAVVDAIQQFGVEGFFIDAAAVLVLAIVAVAAGWLAWKGPEDAAGILGLVSGVGFLLLFPETAGVLALLGATLVLVSTRLTGPTDQGRFQGRRERDPTMHRPEETASPGGPDRPSWGH